MIQILLILTIYKGEALIEQKKFEEAIEAYNMAIKIDPNHADAHNGKGLALQNLKKFNEAINAFNGK